MSVIILTFFTSSSFFIFRFLSENFLFISFSSVSTLSVLSICTSMKGSLPSNSTVDVWGFNRQWYGKMRTPVMAASWSKGPSKKVIKQKNYYNNFKWDTSEIWLIVWDRKQKIKSCDLLWIKISESKWLKYGGHQANKSWKGWKECLYRRKTFITEMGITLKTTDRAIMIQRKILLRS